MFVASMFLAGVTNVEDDITAESCRTSNDRLTLGKEVSSAEFESRLQPGANLRTLEKGLTERATRYLSATAQGRLDVMNEELCSNPYIRASTVSCFLNCRK